MAVLVRLVGEGCEGQAGTAARELPGPGRAGRRRDPRGPRPAAGPAAVRPVRPHDAHRLRQERQRRGPAALLLHRRADLPGPEGVLVPERGRPGAGERRSWPRSSPYWSRPRWRPPPGPRPRRAARRPARALPATSAAPCSCRRPSPQMKSNARSAAQAPSRTSMASCPLVRNRKSGGSAVTSDLTESAMSSAGIHCRALLLLARLVQHPTAPSGQTSLSARFAPIVATAAPRFICQHKHMIHGRLRSRHRNPHASPIPAAKDPIGRCRTSSLGWTRFRTQML